MSPNFTLLDQLYTQERLLNSGYTRTTMRRKLRTKELISVLQGVYIAASVWDSFTPSLQVLARHTALALRDSTCVFCLSSAAFLYGLPLLHVPQNLHVLAGYSARGAASDGILEHTSNEAPAQVTVLRPNFRVTELSQTLLDCARTLPVLEGCALVDAALHRRMLAPEEILPRLQASQNSAATHIATHADARSSSLLESVARLQLVEMGLPAPVHRLDFEAYLLGTSDAHTPNRSSDYAGVYRMLRTRQASFVWLEQRVGLAMVASDAVLPHADAPTPEGWHMVQVRWEDFYPSSRVLREKLHPYFPQLG